jgi:hypothetical protein
VPCLIPRWTERVLASISSPSARPSPNLRRVGVHDFTFEACSGFTRVTARWIAQPPESGLCHEASARPVAQPDRSSATRFIDNFLGGTFLHWQHAPSGRTEKSGLAARSNLAARSDSDSTRGKPPRSSIKRSTTAVLAAVRKCAYSASRQIGSFWLSPMKSPQMSFRAL